jgi:hypothetical protein
MPSGPVQSLFRRMLRLCGADPSSCKPATQRANRRRLCLEYLEDRTLLTTDVFTNALGGAWSEGSNWSLGAPPTSTQMAVVSIGSNGAVTLPSGTVTVAGLTSDGSLLISGGSLSVTGNVSGTVNAAGSGQLLFSGTGATEGCLPSRNDCRFCCVIL